jgi:predicted DNA-binding antitoxin AbrB/MazE fold protein
MSSHSITVEAVFEGGALRPAQVLPLSEGQRVTVTVQLQEQAPAWPADVAAIYQEIADEDRRLASDMFANVRDTWPADEAQP